MGKVRGKSRVRNRRIRVDVVNGVPLFFTCVVMCSPLGQWKSHRRLASELFLKVMLKIFNIQYSICEKKKPSKKVISALKEC